MERVLDVKNKSYYNLRKHFGKEIARAIIGHWLYFNVDYPENAEEAIDFFVLGERCRGN